MEEKETRDMLEDVIRNQIDGLSDLEQGSKEYTLAIGDLKSLYELKIEEYKSRMEIDDRFRMNEKELELKRAQMLEQKTERYFNLGLGVAQLVLPLLFYGSWMRKGFRFEENGSITSTTFRNLLSCFKPTRK
ncbi:MAG: hypothetical protein Q4C65_02645 [Eubacteriales bacterium]|nr:hypothetical protein [Eubacteriales bacterium]